MNFHRRKSGIALIGALPWGSRICQFCQTKADLLDLQIPYLIAGLKNNEFCVWVTSKGFRTAEARQALQKALPRFEKYVDQGQIEIISHSRWRTGGGRSARGVLSLLDKALAGGFDGLRVACGVVSDKNESKCFTTQGFDSISRHNVIALFAYPRDSFDALGLMEVVKNHRFALVRNAGRWEVVESSAAQTMQDALQRSEDNLKLLFSHMSEGFAYHRIMLDAKGKPYDYVFLEVNHAFERLTGLDAKDIVGKTATKALPGIERDPTDWIAKYGEVALTGKPVQFESYSESLKRWYSVSAFSAHQGYFAVTFSDITERKRAEEALRESEGRVRRKLDSILTPEGDLGHLELGDIIDLPALQALVDNLYKFVHLPIGILDLKGKVLVGVGWQDVCTKFHRAHPDACRHCLESDLELSKGGSPGEFKLYKCKNGMWDAVTPFMVGGQHMGNIFWGQFFFDDETVDRGFFRAQARKYGFAEEEYLAALEKVPRINREALHAGMTFYLKLADMLSQLSYGNIKLAQTLSVRDTLLHALRESEELLKQAQEISHLGSWELDLVNNRLAWSDEVYRIFGFEPQEFGATYEAFLAAVHPDDRTAVDAAYSGSIRDGKDTYEIEHRVVRKSAGEIRYVLEKCQHFRDETGKVIKSVGMVQDITKRKQTEKALKALSDSSQAIIRANDEPEYLNNVCRIIVDDCGYSMVWIGFAENNEAQSIRPAAYSGFEEGYLETLQLTWADTERGLGPTGTAIRTGNVAVCRNILTDPTFTPWREEASKRGYASSIVFPLRADGRVFGAITIYSKETDPFTVDEIRLLTELTDNVAYGIEVLRTRTAQKQAEELAAHLASFPQLNPNPVLEVNCSGQITFFNPATVKILETLGMDEADIAIFLPADLDGILASLDRSNEATFRREIVIKDRVFGETISLTPQFKVARIYTHDITDRKLAENVTQARLRMVTASADLSMDAILQMTLDEIETHTGSAIGFYHFLEADQETLSLQAWSSNTLASMCTAEGKGNHYPISRAGVWVDCVQARRPVIHNDYAALPHKKGMPPGHARVVREMLIPIVRKDRIVAIIGVGNKPTEYTETDIEIASLLGDFSWEIVERRRGEEAVKAANRELEAFSYSVSHDLRAPLRAIDGFSKVLLERYHHLLDEKGGDYLKRVRAATQKMAQLIDDLLRLSRLSRGGMRITAVDLSLLAREVAAELRRSQPDRQVSCAIAAGIVAQCDQHLLKVVLDNLLGNAWKFTGNKEQAVIEFGSTLIDGTPTYFVRDNGAGFDMTYVDKLFGTFQRLHLEQDFPGTGIGLSLVQRIIHRHGGKVWAEGEVGQGATFYFTLTPMMRN